MGFCASARLMLGLAALASCAAPAWAHDASSFVASPRQTYNLNPDWRILTADPEGAQLPTFDDFLLETGDAS